MAFIKTTFKVFEGKPVPQDPTDESASVLLEDKKIKGEKAKQLNEHKIRTRKF